MQPSRRDRFETKETSPTRFSTRRSNTPEDLPPRQTSSSPVRFSRVSVPSPIRSSTRQISSSPVRFSRANIPSSFRQSSSSPIRSRESKETSPVRIVANRRRSSNEYVRPPSSKLLSTTGRRKSNSPSREEKQIPSSFVTTEFSPLLIGEFLASTDLINFATSVRAFMPNAKLISKGVSLELPLKISRPELVRLAKIPGIENLIVTLAENEGEGLTKRLWPTLTNFTELKSLALKNESGNYFDVDISFVTTMPNLEELSLQNINIEDDNILGSLNSLRKLTFIDDEINNFLIPQIVQFMTQLTKLSFTKSVIFSHQPHSEIKIRNTDYLNHILLNLTNLTTLDVSMSYFGTHNQMSLLAEHTNLQELSMHSNTLTQEDLKYVAQLIHLTKLDLENCNNIIDITPLQTLTNLTSFNISGFNRDIPERLNDTCLDTLAKFTNLRELNISQAHITTIAPLVKLKYLSSLKMLGCVNIDDEGMKAIAQFEFLACLDLSETNITTDIIQYLSGLKYMSELYMIPSSIDIEGKEEFIQYLGRMHNLTKLHLTTLNLTNEDMQVISTLTNLTYFGNSPSSDNPDKYFDDIGLGYLSNLSKLTELDLYGNHNITTKGVGACLTGLKFLNILRLQDCTSLTNDIFDLLLDVPELKEITLNDSGDASLDHKQYYHFIHLRPDVEVNGITSVEGQLEDEDEENEGEEDEENEGEEEEEEEEEEEDEGRGERQRELKQYRREEDPSEED